MLTDQYPPNLKYEYVLDDILLIISRYLENKGCRFQHAIDELKQFDTLINNDALTINEAALPCYILKEDKQLLYDGYKVILCGDSQSYDFSKLAFNLLISKLIAAQELYICIFPLHLGFSNIGQGGHWNIAALFINSKNKQAKLLNIEPLNGTGEIKEDPAVVKKTFFQLLKDALQDFKLKQVTKQTLQQTDTKLCGAIAAENATIFWGVEDVLQKKYTSIDAALALRKNHINLSDSESFAKKQFVNWVFQGFKNDDYEKADGDTIWHALRKLQLENPGEYADDFATLLKMVNENWESVEATQIKQWLSDFFKKNCALLLGVKVKKESLVLKFFKKTDYEELANTYNVIEVMKCLAKRFETILTAEFPKLHTASEISQSYERNQGYSNTYRGDEYQKLVGMHFALNLYLSGVKKFKILTESAEKEYDFGKFDDLIIETEKQFEVLQVKHAGSMDEGSRVYTIDMLSATKGSKKTDIKKKAALHSYYDSWRKCKDKNKPILFKFYTNHRLDDNLKPFYNDQSECYSHLLEPQNDTTLQANQKKLIDSIYCGSKYFANNIVNTLLTDLKFITTKLNETDWKEFIDNKYNDSIFTTLEKGKHFTKNKNCSEKDYQKIAFLLIGHFGLTASKDKIEIMVPDDYFTRNIKLNPIHSYLYEKLVASFKNNSQRITQKKITFTKALVSQEKLIEIIFPQNNKETTITSPKNNKGTTITFPTKTSAKLYITDEHAVWCISLLFGISTNEISYEHDTYPLNDQLAGKLLEESSLPKYEFTDFKSLDNSICEFIKAFKFQIKQPSITELEKQNCDRIRQHFQIEDYTYYLKFERYFLENFRAPLGEEITFNILDGVFQDAKLEIRRSRLIGYGERYSERFKKGKSNVVSPEQLRAIDDVYQRRDNIITIISGQPYIGKSFTMLMWVKNLIASNTTMLQDSYAFLPMRDVWDTDIELFIDKLKLLIIDNVEEFFDNTEKKSLLKSLIYVAKEYQKKIVLIVNEHKKLELAAMINGIPHHIVDCQPLTNEQIYKFSKVTPKHFLVISNLFVTLEDLLKDENNSGLNMALRNPGLLQQLLDNKLIQPKKLVNKDNKTTDIFIQQDFILKEKINFYGFIEQARGLVLVFNPNSEETFLKSLETNEIEPINMGEFFRQDIKSDKRIAILCEDNLSLPQLKILQGRNDKQERNDAIVVTRSKILFQSLAKFIKHQCYAPNNIGHCQFVETTLSISPELWVSTDIQCNYLNACQMKKTFTKHTLVSVNAGMGKSMLVKQLCQTGNARQLIAEHYHWYIPVYLDQLIASDNQKSFSQFVFMIAQKIYNLCDFFKSIIDQDLKQGNVLLILDGGDQIKEDQLSECYELYHKLISYAHVIFLTRPIQSRILFNANQELVLQSFTDKQIKKYFREAFPDPIVNPFFDAANQFMQENNQLREMLGVPLQCYLFWQAWKPYYEQWQQNSNTLLLPKFLNGDTALIAIFQRYLEARFYIHFKRNLNIRGLLLETRERVNTLSIGYLDRFAHVSVWEHFSDIRPFLHTAITKPIPREWLDKDIEEIALVKRIAAPQSGSVTYVMAHRTYQEYAAAKYFVEGIMDLRQMHPGQKKICKELLSIARFIHIYQQFWRFVLNWIEHHTALNNLSKDTLNKFEQYFKKNGDLIHERENNFWEFLITKRSDFPISYKPDSIPQQSESEESKTNTQIENSVEVEWTKSYTDFNEIKNIIRSYQGDTFMRHDSEVYRAIDDLPNHIDVPKDSGLELLKHAYAPNGNIHDSYRIHEVIARSLCKLGEHNQIACQLLFSYYDHQKFQKSDNVFGLTKVNVLKAAKTFTLSEENIDEFFKLLHYFQAAEDEFGIDVLEAVNHIFSSILANDKLKDNANLYEKFEGFYNKLKNISNGIEMSERNYIAIQNFIKIQRKFEKEFEINYICSVKNLDLSIMLIYAQYGERLFPSNAKDEDITAITNKIRDIPKNNISKVVTFMTKEGHNTFLLLKLWLSIEFNDNLSDSQDYHLHLKQIQNISSNFNTLRISCSTYKEIDGAIPAICELQTGFNSLMAAYLISLMNKSYWQYPVALKNYIPYLLKYHVDHKIYPHLAIFVYQTCLEKIIIATQDYDSLEKFFYNDHVDAYTAMDYAWRVYTNTNSKEAAYLIFTWSTYLQWPLFKASQAVSLHLVTPGTGHVKEFKARDKSHLDCTVTFFKQAKRPRVQEEELSKAAPETVKKYT